MTETEQAAGDGYADMRVIDLRREIHRRLGINGMEGTALTTMALNSLVAYLTGELPGSPGELHTQGGINKPDLMKMVAREVLLEDWFDHRDATGNERPFDKSELVDILEHMDKTGDQREWSGEPTELGEA